MINRSTFMMSASAIICVCCGLSFADPATDSQDGNEILKAVQVQRYEIARAARARRRGYVPQNAGLGANNAQMGTATTGKDEQQKEEKVVKDEQTNAAKDDATKQEQKDVQETAQTEQKDVQDAAQTEQKDVQDDAQTEQKDIQDAAQTEQKDVQDDAQTEQKDVKDDAQTEQKDAKDDAQTEQKDAKDDAQTEQKDAKDDAQTEQKDAKDDEGKKDDNAAKDDETKKEEPASPFKDPQAALAFQEFNNFRIRSGLRPCEFNQNLQNIAQWHSNNMYNRQQMYHSGVSGVAENVFMGSSSGVYAVRVWMNSPGHRANMLGPYRRVGIARTGCFFTMVLQ